MSLRPRLNIGLNAAVLLVLAACGQQANTPSASEASASPSVSPSASPSAEAEASESATTSGPPRLRMGELTAGQYTTNAFEPELVLTLPGGWSQFFPDEDDEIALGGPGAELNITRPPEVVDPETRAPAETPESLLEWFTSHTSLDVGEPVEVEIDGIASHYVDVAAPSSEINIFHYPPGDMRLSPGVPSRIYIVPFDGPDLVALILAPAGADDFEAVLATAAIVTSLIIND